MFTIWLTLAGLARSRLLLLGLAAGAGALAGGAFGAASCFVFAVTSCTILLSRTGAGCEEQGAAGGKEGNEACHELDRLNLD